MNDAEAILNMQRSVRGQISKVKEKEYEANRVAKTSATWWSGETAEAFNEYYRKLSRQLEHEYELVRRLESNLGTLSTNVKRAINEEKAKKAGR